jgi:centromeric protein E
MGVTESVVRDIYEHIRKTQERSLVYNETVVDLLNRDTEPVGLLNDLEVFKGLEALSQLLK